MTIRDWIIERLDSSFTTELEGKHGLCILRPSLPVAFVYCIEPSEEQFTGVDLETAYLEMSRAQFMVLIRRHADGGAYEHAEELGVCLAGFNELRSALNNDFDISQHLSSEQKYLSSRLRSNPHVRSVRRRGRSTYEVLRSGQLSTLNIVTITEYELTSDAVYEILEQHPDIAVDAIVSTNPYCHGFAPEVYDAGRRSGVRVLSLNDFLDALQETWI